MGLGILESVGLVGSLVFALPVGIAGVQFLLGGRTGVGAVLVVVAVLMVAVPRYVTGPGDVAGRAAERAAGAVVKPPDEGTEERGD